MSLPDTAWADEQLPGKWYFIVTEDGEFLITEDGEYVVTEESEGTTWTDE